MANEFDIQNKPANSYGGITDPPWGYASPKGSGQITPLMPELKFSWYDPGGLDGSSTATPIEKWVGPENFEIYFNAHRRLAWDCPVDSESMRPMHAWWPKTQKPGHTYAQRLDYENTFYTNFLKKWYSSEPWGNPAWDTDPFNGLGKRYRWDQNKDWTPNIGGGRRHWLWPPFKWYCRPEFSDWKQDGWQWIQDYCYESIRTRPCSWVWEHPTTDLLFHVALFHGGSDTMDIGREVWHKAHVGNKGDPRFSEWDYFKETRWGIGHKWYDLDAQYEQEGEGWPGPVDNPYFTNRNWTDGHHFDGSCYGYGAALGMPVGYISLWKLWSIYCGLHDPAPGVSFSHGNSFGKWTPWPTANDCPFFLINVLLHCRMAGFDNADPDMLKNFACGEPPWGPLAALEYNIKELLTSAYGGTDDFVASDGIHNVLPWKAGPSNHCSNKGAPGEINPINDRIDPNNKEWYWPDRGAGINFGRVPGWIRNYSPLPFLAFINARDLWHYVKDNTGHDLFDPDLMNGIDDWLRDAKKFCEHLTPTSKTVYSVDGEDRRYCPGDWLRYRPHHSGNALWHYDFPGDGPQMDRGFGITLGAMNDMKRDAANGYSPCSGGDGWNALEYMYVMWKLETVPDEYIWLVKSQTGKFDAGKGKWEIASITSSSQLWCGPAWMTMLGGQHPRGRAIVDENPIWSYHDDTDGYGRSNRYGWPSVFNGVTHTVDSNWTAEVCSFLDYFVKQYQGEADDVQVDLAASPANSYSEATDVTWDSGPVAVDLAGSEANSYAESTILGDYVNLIGRPADAWSEATDPNTAVFGGLSVNLAGEEAEAWGTAFYERDQTIDLGIAHMYGECFIISPSGLDVRRDLQGEEAESYGTGINPSVDIDGDKYINLEGVEAIAWSESIDPSWDTGDFFINLEGSEAESYGTAEDPDVVGEGPWVRNPEVAYAYSRSGTDSPEFDYELTYNTTGEEYTLGGT